MTPGWFVIAFIIPPLAVAGPKVTIRKFLDSIENVDDLMRFGLIPEFIGRLPVVTSVSVLDRAAMMSVLTEPKNALTAQYRRLFELDGVELEFEEKALEVVADMAIERGTGARGLRSILENILLQVMYDVPSRKDIAKVVLTEQTVLGVGDPTMVPREITPRSRRSSTDKRDSA